MSGGLIPVFQSQALHKHRLLRVSIGLEDFEHLRADLQHLAATGCCEMSTLFVRLGSSSKLLL